MSKDYGLIIKAFTKHARAKQLSEQEREALAAWRRDLQANGSVPDLLLDREWVDQHLRELDEVLAGHVREAMCGFPEKDGNDKKAAPAVRTLSRRPRRTWMAAAGVFILLGNGAYLLKQSFFGRNDKPSGGAALVEVGVAGHYRSVTLLEDGSRQVMDTLGRVRPFDLTLPDGSKVKLCFGSSLRYRETFDAGKREVYLNGQACFDIAQNENCPFIVHTGGTAIKVLGTRFNVMAYAGEPSEITLLAGKVQVNHGAETRILNPLEQAIIDSKLLVRKQANPAKSLGWMNKDPFIAFDNADLNTVVQRLARWYGVKVNNSENVKGVAITGPFRLQDPLDSNMQHIADVERMTARLERRGDTIFLSHL
jgi:ferric-dicitrate binding protein FerR (iron transport regulator)